MKRLLTLTLLYCPIWLSAQGFQVHIQGQKQQAMGNGGTGLVQDAASIFYNPGAVSFLQGNSINAAANVAIVKSVFRDSLTGILTHSDRPISVAPTVYAVYGVDSSTTSILKNFKFGLGIYTPFAGSAKYPDGWVGRYVTKSLELKFICIQPTVSYKINKMLGVGAGFVQTLGSMDVRKDVFLAGVSGNEGSAHLSGRLSGMGYNLGVFFKPTESLSFGLSYRSGIKMKSKGATAEFTTPPSLKDSVPNGGVSLTMPLPTVISFGVGYKLTDKFTMAFDVRYIGFKVFDTLRVDFEHNTGSLLDVADPRMFKNTYSFHLGGQYLATEALTVRAGIRYALTPIPDGRTTPEGGDANHFVWCAGLGYKINNHFTLDASYSFQSMERSDNNKFYNILGDYKTYASIAGLALIYNF